MPVATVHSVHLPLSLKCWKKDEPGVSRLLCYYITFPRKLQHIPNTVLAIISPNLYNIGVIEKRISKLNGQTAQACLWQADDSIWDGQNAHKPQTGAAPATDNACNACMGLWLADLVLADFTPEDTN